MEEKQEDQEEYHERHAGEQLHSRLAFEHDLDRDTISRPLMHFILYSFPFDTELAQLISEVPQLAPELRVMANSLVVLLAGNNAE